MSNKFLIAFIILIFSLQCFAQTDSSAVSDTLQRVMIYRQAFKTASNDKRIKDDEKSILKSLRKSLNLSKFDAKDIEYKILFSQQNILDQSGRWPLVLQNIVWGAGLYGWGLPYILNVNDGKWFIASELLSFSTSFYLTYKYTKNMNIPHSRAQMMRYGSLVGYHYGWSLGKIMKLESDMESENKAWIGILMASVPAGIWVGDKLYQHWQPTNGQSWAISLATMMGAMATNNIHYTIDEKPEEPEEPFCNHYSYNPENNTDEWIDCENEEEYKIKYQKYEKDLEDWERIQGILYLGAYPVSMYLGNKIFGDKDYSFGDATILYQGWGIGMLYSIMLLDIVNIEENDAYSLGTILGGLTGVYIYDKAILSGYDFSIGESILLTAGSLSGGTFGAAIGVIAETDREFIEIGAIAGSIVGTWITRNILNPEKDGLSNKKNDGIKLSISPDIKYLPNSSVSPFIPGINLQLDF